MDRSKNISLKDTLEDTFEIDFGAVGKATSNNAIALLEDVVSLYLSAAHGLAASFERTEDGLR